MWTFESYVLICSLHRKDVAEFYEPSIAATEQAIREMIEESQIAIVVSIPTHCSQS
jgi:hypothetical protein